MYLDIQPYQFERIIERPLSCFDDIIYTLAKWTNRQCYFMFIDRWNFKIEDNESKICGEIFNSEYSINDNFLRKYHGIDISEKKIDTYYELLNILKDELLNGNPIIVIFDAYECPWDQFYGKYHNRHMCIVVGIDFDNEIIYMCDPYNNRKKEEVSFNQYKKGYMEYYFSVKFSDEYDLTDNDKLGLIITSLKDKFKMFSYIHDFANYFGKYFNPDYELNGADHYFGTSLHNKLNILIWNIWSYAMLIKYIGIKNEQLMDVFEKLRNIALIWNNINLMIAKSFYLENHIVYIEKIVEKIHNVAFIEETSCLKLQDICETKLDSYINKCANLNNGKTEILVVSLKDYFNNKGLSHSNKNMIADFTGGKEYLVFDFKELYKHNIYAGDGVVFDNISCIGQVIKLNNVYVKYMIISGCSEWGDYEDVIIIKNKRDINMINISISDMSHEPKFGEDILITGRAYEYTNNIVKIKQERVNIFQTKLSVLDEVDSFELPICPNMHIFSISIVI